jgi:hypothetical protein
VIYSLKNTRVSSASGPSKIIFITFDVVLFEGIAGLNLDKHHVALSDIFDTVPVVPAYIHGLTGDKPRFPSVAGKERLTRHYEPVFRPPFMALEAHAFALVNGNTLDLMIVIIGQIFKKTPGAVRIATIQLTFPVNNDQKLPSK